MKQEVHRLSRRDARRVAIRAQLLDARRPDDALGVVRHLGVVQIDLTEAVARSADLVLWSRLGRTYAPRDLEDLLAHRRLVEFESVIRPAEDMALFRAEMAAWPGPEPRREWQDEIERWVRANDACRRDLLDHLRMDGPLPATALPDTCDVSWRSSGWTNDKNVQRMLGFMEARGEVAVADRENGARVWDLAERVYPPNEPVELQAAQRERERRRLAALGIARVKGPSCAAEPVSAGEAGEPAEIEGVRGIWRVDPAQLGQTFRGRTALLSPLDRLISERKRMAEIFEFDYQLEMFKPKAKRRWGYYALPILHGDRLVGKVDANADRRAGVLWIDAIHEDEPFSSSLRGAVHREIRSLARMLELDLAER